MKRSTNRNGSVSFLVVALVFLVSIFLCGRTAVADSITIPWTVNLHIPAGSVVPPFDATYSTGSLGADTALGHFFMSLGFNTTFTHSYDIHLPFQIQINYPHDVSAGQTVFLDSSATLAGPPSFTVDGTYSYSTALAIDSSAGNVAIPIPNLSYNAVSIDTEGSGSYTATDSTAENVLARTIWKNDPYGNTLNMIRATQFEGYELNVSQQSDAWAMNVGLLGFLGNWYPVIEAISYIADLEVGLGLDVIDNTSLTTQFVTGYYTYNGIGGPGYNNFLINGATQKGYLTIPASLTPGQTFDVQMTALGLGFTTLFDYLTVGNLDLALKLFSLYDVDIAGVNFGSGSLVDSWADRFQYLQFLSDFGFPLQDAVLSFNIVPSATPTDPSKTAPNYQLASIDGRIQQLLDTNASQSQQSYDFPGNPPVPSVTGVSEVPEPTSLLLLGTGLAGLARWRRRRT